MDKTVQLLLVIVVAMVTALIVITMVTGQTDSFEGFLGDTSKNSKCDFWAEQDNPPSEFSECPQSSGNLPQKGTGGNP